MGKKHRKTPVQQPGSPVPATNVSDRISVRGKTTIGTGIVILVGGFIVLSFADPMGRNWAAHLAPFLILGGYAVVGFGVFLPSEP